MAHQKAIRILQINVDIPCVSWSKEDINNLKESIEVLKAIPDEFKLGPEYILLSKSKYKGNDGNIHTACMYYDQNQNPIYYTHKDNL